MIESDVTEQLEDFNDTEVSIDGELRLSVEGHFSVTIKNWTTVKGGRYGCKIV